jgi:hypothetical protein
MQDRINKRDKYLAGEFKPNPKKDVPDIIK